MTLDQAERGQHLRIQAFDDCQDATLMMRLGLDEGALVQLVTKVPGGPLVLRRGQSDVAIGRDMGRRIQVSLEP
jgi:Fe2+ transport system protein FeoA